MNLQDGVSIYESLKITAFSMSIVFITLFIISLILGTFKLIFSSEDDKKVEDKKKQIATITSNSPIDDKTSHIDEEIIAVIIAAIKAHGSNIPQAFNGDIKAAILASIATYEGKSTQDLRISNIRVIS